MNKKSYKAYAKINIVLDVLKKRVDGYHDMKMIMQKVNIYDELTFEIVEENKITIECNVDLCEAEQNLCYKATKQLFNKHNITKGVNISINKKIPHQAGMGGGSADCATTLIAINEIFDLGNTIEELASIGKQLGADVPYCLYGNTMIAEGIGNVLKPIVDFPKSYVLVAKPNIGVSTKYIFENLNITEERNLDKFNVVVKGIEEKNIKKITENMYNKLEDVTATKYNVINDIKNIMMNNGALISLMSGSGSAVFGIYTDEYTMEEAFEAISTSDIQLDFLQKTTTKNY